MSWTNEIPEEIKMVALADKVKCWIDKTEDGLNSCSIEKIPRGAIQLVLQFDLYIGEAIGEGEQITVGTYSEFPNAYTSPWMKIDNNIIEQLKSGVATEKKLTNAAGAQLTIRFEPN
jgi:hypothetical protein